MSIDETAAPKRRSSAANRRRTRRPATQAQPQAAEGVSASVATAETNQASSRPARGRKPAPEVVEAEPVATADTANLTPEERAAQRREERRRAKQQRPERSGMGRVVNTERMSGVRKFYNDTASEIRKVVWPDRETTRNLTLVVIVMSLIMGLLLGGIDFVLFRLFEAIT